VTECFCRPNRTAGGSELSCKRVQLKPSGGTALACGEQLENNQGATSPQPTKPTCMVMSHQVLPPKSPQTPLKPAQPTENSDGLPMTTRSGSVVKKHSRLIEHFG